MRKTQNMLAMMYSVGRGVQRNTQLGREYRRKAAQNGSVEAQATLGSVPFGDTGNLLLYFDPAPSRSRYQSIALDVHSIASMTSAFSASRRARSGAATPRQEPTPALRP